MRKLDQLQAWLILSEFLQINPHLPSPVDRPQIVKDAIDTLDKSINTGMEGEQEIDEKGNRVGEPEIIVRLSECQSEDWEREVTENSKELNNDLPLWKQKTIRIKDFCISTHEGLRSDYDYEVILPDNKIGYHGRFKVEKWMSQENIRNSIAELFCPPGYNFGSKSMSFHFEKKNIVYKFSYARSGTDNGQMAIGW